MRGSFLVILLLIPLVGSSEVSGQARKHGVYLSTGVAFPMGPGDLVDWWKPGPTLDVAYGRRVGPLELAVSFGRASMPLDRGKLLVVGGQVEVSGGTARILSAGGSVLLRLERGTWFQPYLRVGVEVHRLSIDDVAITVHNPDEVCPGEASCSLVFAPADRPDETALGIRLGAGVAWYLSESVRLFAEPAYHLMLFDESGRVGMVPLRLGLVYAFP